MKRPLSVTFIGYLFIVAGTVGIIYHASELKGIIDRPEVIWVLAVRLLAIVGGLFTLRGANWARWLLVAWIVYHVILSISHSFDQLVMHAAIAVVIVIALFNKSANIFFTRKN